MREILTVQCGPYSNFIGSHFWNIQDKDLVYQPRPVLPPTNPNVLFREGQSLNKEVTFTPRLISVDLKGGLGALPRYGELYSVEEKDGHVQLWEGDIRKENRSEAEDEKDVDETEVASLGNYEFWSDYLVPRLHPNSNVVLEEFQKGNTLRPFDIFGLGTRADENEEESTFESIRFFAEETDHLSGFHFLSDADSGFGGLAHKIKDHFLDEYPRKSILSFPTWPSLYSEPSDVPFSPLRNPTRFLNISLSLYYLHESSLLTPLSLNPGYFPLPKKPSSIPGMGIDHLSLYQSSALLASAIDTLSLPWRLKSNPAPTFEFVDALSIRGRKCLTLSTAMMMTSSDAPHIHSLTPGFQFSPDSQIRIQSAIQRGTPTKFDLEDYLKTNFPQSYNSYRVVQDEGSPIGRPYPRIFDSVYDKDERMNMITSWSSSDTMEKILNDIAAQASKLNLNKMSRFLEAGLEEDEFKEVINGLMNIADDYSNRCDL
uniref:Misato homolog 1 n=1 Tax=Caligus rogercresseyi TaxID=217165 RepID=C1BN10_CALRO|nr:misato homolog 1 [Caligus rogercresseyi]